MKGRNMLIGIILLTSILFTTIVYAAFSTQLNIDGEAIVRSDQDIRITNISISSTTNGAYETYNNKYNKDTTFMYVTLPSNSSITYEIEISNTSNIVYTISEIEELSNSNSTSTYDISGEYIIVNKNNTKTFTITLTNNTSSVQQETLILKYIFEEAQATFISGDEFLLKVKKMSNPTISNLTYTTNDYNITSIVRTDILSITPTSDNIVSTNDSTVPIYVWYDNGIIYYYTKAESPYMNSISNGMFRNLLNLKNIDLSSINTSKVTQMNSMFWFDKSLVSLDLSSFDTSKVIVMGAMFEYCQNLQNLNISSFNTSKVQQFTYMFRYSTSFVSLDLSNFIMSSATDTSGMLQGMTSLKQLKTPKVYPNNLSIDLPNKLYDENNNEYSLIDITSPTQTWLKNQ